MLPIRIAASLALLALARSAAAQTVAADSLSPGTPVRVVLRPSEAAAPPSTTDGSVARPERGQIQGVFRGRYDSWDGAGLHVTEPRSGMTWTFPASEVASVDARTSSDRSRSALVRGALVGAVVGAVGVYFYNAARDNQFNKLAFGEYSTQMMHGAAIGFVVGAAWRYERPAGHWEPVRPPEQKP